MYLISNLSKDWVSKKHAGSHLPWH